MQDEEGYGEAVDRLHDVIKRATSINPTLQFEVLIHKLDGDRFGTADAKLGMIVLVTTRINSCTDV